MINLDDFTYLFTYRYVAVFGYGCLRLAIDRNTGEIVLSYVV